MSCRSPTDAKNDCDCPAAPAPCTSRTSAAVETVRAHRRKSLLVSAQHALGMLEWLLSQRVVLVFLSSVIFLCSAKWVQSAHKRVPTPDFGIRNGVDMLNPHVGVVLTRERILAQNHVGTQRKVVMRRACQAGSSSKSCTPRLTQSSVDDPIETLERTARNLVAAGRRSSLDEDILDPVLGKQLFDIYSALSNIHRSREQHFEAFQMMQLADEAAASAGLELEDQSAD